MVWRTSAVITGATSTACASTMALNEKSHPRKPKGPECDSSRYSASPTTTEGKANEVFKMINTSPRPRKRATASHAPNHLPTTQASAHAQALTASERHTIESSTGSADMISAKAVATLSDTVFMAGKTGH